MSTRHDNTDPGDFYLDGLLAAARGDRPDTSRAEYGFETRLTARLAAPEPDMTFWWAAWTWRLAPLFAAIALSLYLWSHYTPGPEAADERTLSEWSAVADDDFGGWLLGDDLPFS